VFLILEFFSLFLLSSSYSYHKSIKFNITSDISGNILNTTSNISDYFFLKGENEKLLLENANLRNQLLGSFLTTDTNTIFVDTLFQFIPAKIVSNSTSMQLNRIIVNKGKLHGVEKEMGVITSEGLAGIVIGVSDHYSTIMSALSKNANFSAKIKESGQLVNISWSGENYKIGIVTDIPSHIQLLKGDTIVSSGNSILFPEGIMIGVIDEHQQRSDKDMSSASLKFSVDFNKLHHVYIIKNKMKQEIDSLLLKIGNE
jgi:rod shape-determining protein MreC